MSRTALFIDAGYFDKLMINAFADQQGGRKVAMPLDYKRLSEAMVGERPWRAYYYYAMPWVSDPPLPVISTVALPA